MTLNVFVTIEFDRPDSGVNLNEFLSGNKEKLKIEVTKHKELLKFSINLDDYTNEFSQD